MKLRWGFKKEAEAYAEEFRRELSLPLTGALCPFRLAEHLLVPVVGVSDLPDLGQAIADSLVQNEINFSAMTVIDDHYCMIIHNDAHHPYRQNSNVMHEIAHILLGHPPHPPLLGDRCRQFDKVAEREANELSFTLLIPKRAALRIIESRMALELACDKYGVSKPLLRYRIAVTDARRWAENRRKYRGAA